MSFRNGVFFGSIVAVVAGLFLVRLWQPETQIRKHSAHLLEAIEHKDWTAFASLIGEDYRDQWDNDRATVLERTREVFHYARGAKLSAIAPAVEHADRRGFWRARIMIEGNDQNEVVAAIKARVNPLPSPFELEWRQVSGKPWDWKLVRVRNPELVIPQ